MVRHRPGARPPVAEAPRVLEGRVARDFAVRMQQFFDHYLKDAPAPKWLSEGVTFLDCDVAEAARDPQWRFVGIEIDWESLEALYAEGARIFVEVGPGTVLTNRVGEILADRPHRPGRPVALGHPAAAAPDGCDG